MWKPLPCLLSSFLLILLCFYPTQGSDLVCGSPDHGNTLKVMHVYHPCSPFRPSKFVTWEETVLDMAAKDEARLLYLLNLAAKKSVVPIASGRQIIQSSTYILRANIGTPAQTLLVAMDTSNDAAWIPCDGCVGCSSTVFDSTHSTTYKTLDCQATQCKQVPNPSCTGSTCSFNLAYGSSTFAAKVSQDTVILAADAIQNYSFGCLQQVTGNSIPAQGLIGLGRGPLSLLSQTQDLYNSTFSYCLPNLRSLNFSGSLRLGPVGQPKKIKYTPLLQNPKRSSLYYVNMTGISVGNKLVAMPQSALAFDATTGAGTIIDSGTVFTRLVALAYVAVRDEFRGRIKNANASSLGGFDTCYSVPIVPPAITFHFTGVDLKLPPDNMLIRSSSGSISCLGMAASPANVNSVLNVIASMQQQNQRVVFDVPNSRVGIAREVCT